ncbi:MAG: hypothetical protein WD035_06865 [Balneolaceae bacterium]
MDIFKLIYEHDLRLDNLRTRLTDRKEQDVTLSIEEFMRPDPTYSKFYLTGTRLDEERFGLNTLQNFSLLLDALEKALGEYLIIANRQSRTSLKEALEQMRIGEAILLTTGDRTETNLPDLYVDSGSNVGHRKEPLRNALSADELVLYKEQAHHGYDLHLFSRANIYEALFFPLQKLVTDEFRFFSINGKRINSERKFYFETWTLHRPPHGAEEVFPETVL